MTLEGAAACVRHLSRPACQSGNPPRCTPTAPTPADALRASDAGSPARLSGWVHSKRDHGGLLFVDLRDHYGLTQCVFPSGTPAFDAADGMRVESVITVTGQVVRARRRHRQPASCRPARSSCGPRPSPCSRPPTCCRSRWRARTSSPRSCGCATASSTCGGRSCHRNMILRAGVIASIRRRMIEAGFTEFQTPILTASSPEGARDFLVPARLHPRQVLRAAAGAAAVQAAGHGGRVRPLLPDRALLPRRGGPRRTARLEFYQLDFEMSFVTQEDVFTTLEPVMAGRVRGVRRRARR